MLSCQAGPFRFGMGCHSQALIGRWISEISETWVTIFKHWIEFCRFCVFLFRCHGSFRFPIYFWNSDNMRQSGRRREWIHSHHPLDVGGRAPSHFRAHCYRSGSARLASAVARPSVTVMRIVVLRPSLHRTIPRIGCSWSLSSYPSGKIACVSLTVFPLLRCYVFYFWRAFWGPNLYSLKRKQMTS